MAKWVMPSTLIYVGKYFQNILLKFHNILIVIQSSPVRGHWQYWSVLFISLKVLELLSRKFHQKFENKNLDFKFYLFFRLLSPSVLSKTLQLSMEDL